MNTEFRWNKQIKQIANEAVGGNKTLLFMANEAKRLMDPYVPALNMVLSKNVRTYVEGDHGVVHYQSPYARFQHAGYLMVSRITGSPWAKSGESKVVTGKKLQHSTFRHPLATSEWDQAMKAARMGDLTNAVQRYVKGGF
jgi:hypothetical protein